MPEPVDIAEKGDQVAEVENTSGKEDGSAPETKATSRLQPPAIIANMSLEDRQALEVKLKRKIDLRLMPAIIIMYILNYIDR
jgi:hypothetical protein